MKTHLFWIGLILCALTGCSSSEGKEIYLKNCAGCHDRGVAGAPSIGDKNAWAPRLARGEKALIMNSIQGYTGKAGIMPARGGNSSLSDEQVRAATLYLLNNSR